MLFALALHPFDQDRDTGGVDKMYLAQIHHQASPCADGGEQLRLNLFTLVGVQPPLQLYDLVG